MTAIYVKKESTTSLHPVQGSKLTNTKNNQLKTPSFCKSAV